MGKKTGMYMSSRNNSYFPTLVTNKKNPLFWNRRHNLVDLADNLHSILNSWSLLRSRLALRHSSINFGHNLGIAWTLGSNTIFHMWTNEY